MKQRKAIKKVLVNKGALLSEVRVATVPKCKSNVKGVWVEGGGGIYTCQWVRAMSLPYRRYLCLCFQHFIMGVMKQ